jgi:outer membrane lipopolysaccharide assembly protein LptE/RlpB
MATAKVPRKQIAVVRAITKLTARAAAKLQENDRLALELTDGAHEQDARRMEAALARAGLRDAKVTFEAPTGRTAAKKTTVTVSVSVHVPGTNWNIEGSFSFTVDKKD